MAHDAAPSGTADTNCELGGHPSIFDISIPADAVAPATLGSRLRRRRSSGLDLVPPMAAMTAAAAARAAIVITCDFKAGGPAPVEVQWAGKGEEG